MMPAAAQDPFMPLRRRVAVLGLITALGTGAVIPLATSAAASESTSTSTSTSTSVQARTAAAQESARPQLRRVVRARPAPRGRVSEPATKPAVKPVASPAPAAESGAEAYQQRLLVLVNQERGKRGLRPLGMAACSDAYADRWADSMARRGVMEHQPLRPILDACRARVVAENVAFGNVTADRMMQMWMNSPGHRTNILRPEMTHLGIGSTMRADGRVYACQVFLSLR